MPRTLHRRPRAAVISTAILACLVASVGLLLSGCGPFGSRVVSTIGEVEFAVSLPIPPLAESKVDENGVRVFELEAREGTSEFRAGIQTTTWGFNQAYLGPTIVAAAGERVAITYTNALDEPSTVHWHGVHVPAEMDGGPHQLVGPDETWRPEWTVDQNAATLWYHPHPHGETEGQVGMGLAGLFIVTDAAEAALPLPRDYGVDDIPVIVQDVNFTDDGEIDHRGTDFVGTLGTTLLVNGAIGPILDVSTDVVRLRLLNASTARIYDFTFDDSRAFAMVASDGGLLERALTLENIQLSPGERAEILVRMTPGETAVLQSRAPDLGDTVVFLGDNGGSDSFDVLELRANATLEHRSEVPAALLPVVRLDPASATAERRFDLDGTQINQRAMDMGRIDEVVTVGSTEIWNVRNGMAAPHNFHIHDVQFQVLSIAGSDPPGELAGWKDTVYLRPNTDYRLIMRFEDYANPSVPYMYHCHLLNHEDKGMMGQFVVVEPGQEHTTIEEDDHDH